MRAREPHRTSGRLGGALGPLLCGLLGHDRVAPPVPRVPVTPRKSLNEETAGCALFLRGLVEARVEGVRPLPRPGMGDQGRVWKAQAITAHLWDEPDALP